MSAYEALQLAIRLRKKKQEQKQEEPMAPAPKPRRISREEAILELAEMQHAYSILGQELVAQGSNDASREKVKNCIQAIDLAIRALKREQKAADTKRKEKADGA